MHTYRCAKQTHFPTPSSFVLTMLLLHDEALESSQQTLNMAKGQSKMASFNQTVQAINTAGNNPHQEQQTTTASVTEKHKRPPAASNP